MGYEMRPIANQQDAQRRPPGGQPSPDQNRGFRPPARTGRDYSRIKCFSCGEFGHMQSRLDQRVGTSNLVMLTTVRETLNRSGHTGLYALHPAPLSSPHITSTSSSSTKKWISCLLIHNPLHVQKHVDPKRIGRREYHGRYLHRIQLVRRTKHTSRRFRPENRWNGKSGSVDDQQPEEDIMQISGKGHWFLECWIGDHAVDFLVDSGSAVTAISRPFFNRLSEAGAPVGMLRPTSRKLRGANGSQIEISGCSYCMVLFLGLRTEFPVLVCDLSTDAIIGTDTLGSILPHTLDIKNGLLFTEGGVSLQLHRRDAALSGRVFTVGHCSIPPHSEAVLHCTTRTVGGRSLPPSGLLEGLTVFSENTGLVVGRTLVDPSGWKVPVLGQTLARILLWWNCSQRWA